MRTRRRSPRSGKVPLYVTNLTELEAALASIYPAGGRVIALAAGNYGDFNFYDKSFSDYVTIKSADADGGAVFHSIKLTNVDNIRFDNISGERPLDPEQGYWNAAFKANYCDGIEVINSKFVGSTDENYTNDGYGISIDGSNNVLVDNNIMHDLFKGGLFGANTNIYVTNNIVHDVQSDGFNFSQTINGLIENNVIYNIRPAGEVHADYIQFWNANVGDEASQNITIRGNLVFNTLLPGAQGILMQDEVHTSQYRNIVIENNIIFSTSLHGISFNADFDGLLVKNNLVLGIPGTPNLPAILLKTSGGGSYINAEVSDNIATAYLVDPAHMAGVNLVAQHSDALSQYYYSDLFLNAFNPDSIQDFLPVPGSAFDFGSGLGPWELLSTVAKPAVYIQAQRPQASIDSQSVTFTVTPYPGGELPPAPRTYQWDFGDGTQATGQIVAHDYQTTGPMQVTVTVDGGGQSETIDTQIPIASPLLVDIAFDNTLVNLGVCGGTLSWSGTPSYSSGVDGQAANLEAVGSSIITLSGASSSLSGMAQLTISFDIRVDVIQADASPLWMHTVYGFYIENSKITFSLNTPDGYFAIAKTSATTLVDGGWHHLTATYDSFTGVANLYLDGTVIATSAAVTGRIVFASNRTLLIGSDGSAHNFDGQIDNLHIYSGLVPPADEATILADLRARI